MQIIIGVLLLVGVFILTRFGIIWKIKRASRTIMHDLQRLGAFHPDSAAELPYAKSSFFRIGMRDYRPKALESLIQSSIVSRTESGKYYLTKGDLVYEPAPL